MKLEIPDQLKSDIPQTKWGKILSATPVVMAVLSTMLAALSTSEMSRAQYDRSLAAQQQSKAGDQWSFFQAKRQRGSIHESALGLLSSLAPGASFNAQAAAALVQNAGPGARDALTALETGAVPVLNQSAQTRAEIADALQALSLQKPDNELAAKLIKVSDEELTSALRAAQDRARALDQATEPINKGIAALDAAIEHLAPTMQEQNSLHRDFTAAKLRYSAARYEAEARLNQAVAVLYELQVRKSNLSAQRHHTRSQRFFYGMLAAQAAVIVATFAMAARKRTLLWGIAAVAGLVAVAFAAYVYLYV